MFNENANTTDRDASKEVHANALISDEFPDGVLEAAALEIGVCSTTSPRPCNDC